MNHRPDPKRSPCVVGLALLAFASTLVAAPLLAQPIEVTSADPPAAEQGTVNLNVTLRGSGFAQGAAASFLLTGTQNPGGIFVRSTTFRGPRKLIANIDIDADAEVADFDIEVQANGRIGRGTELFRVNAAENGGETGGCEGAISALFRDAEDEYHIPTDRVRSDLFGVPYVGGELEVAGASIDRFRFSIVISGGSGDPGDRQFILDFSECASPGECTPPADFAPGGDLFGQRNKRINPDLNLCTMANGATLGGIWARIRFYTQDDPGRSWFVVFAPAGVSGGPNWGGLCAESSFLSVTRSDESAWEFGLGPAQIGCLLREDARGSGFSFHGLYRMPFLVTAERLP